MKYNFILILLLALSFSGKTQTYAYSFSGVLSFDQITILESKCMTLKAIDLAKVKYKEEKQIGEIILRLAPRKKIEEGDEFSATDIKGLLIESNLSPRDFRIIRE